MKTRRNMKFVGLIVLLVVSSLGGTDGNPYSEVAEADTGVADERRASGDSGGGGEQKETDARRVNCSRESS